jgi:hypothetical protein
MSLWPDQYYHTPRHEKQRRDDFLAPQLDFEGLVLQSLQRTLHMVDRWTGYTMKYVLYTGKLCNQILYSNWFLDQRDSWMFREVLSP